MSGLPKQCCATGSLHTGTPTGRIEKLHGLDCYIAEPPSGEPKGVVVIIPDAFGWTLPNNRILADSYAKKGNFLVYLPDFMDGYIIPPDLLVSFNALSAPGLMANIKKIYHLGYMMYNFLPFLYWNTPGAVRPRILSFFRAIASSPPTSPLPVAAAGFCWGGKYTIELASGEHKTSPPVGLPTPQSQGQSGGTGANLLVAGFTAHPSFVGPADFEKVELPLSVAAASIDQGLPEAKQEEVRKILEGKNAKGKDGGVEHQFVVFEGAKHGFAVRADEEDVEEAERGRQAERQAIEWFTKWFEAEK